jgi:hypothetical protein
MAGVETVDLQLSVYLEMVACSGMVKRRPLGLTLLLSIVELVTSCSEYMNMSLSE